MHGHLVTIEVGVERTADQGVQLDGLALDQYRFEGLDAESVERRRPVEHDRMLTDHFIKDVPHLGAFLLDHLLGRLDGSGQTAELQFAEDEGLEQFQRHLLGQTTLMQFQGRTHHDDRATRIVHPLAKQVLPEAALLALDHVRQRLQRALV